MNTNRLIGISTVTELGDLACRCFISMRQVPITEFTGIIGTTGLSDRCH